MENKAIREAIKEAGLRHWEIAKELGIADTTFCRWLRSELTAEKKSEILAAIDKIKRKGN